MASVVREAFVVRPFDDIELPQGSVRAVHVGQKGYLWAGTREGLVQYKSGQQKTWLQTSDGVLGLPSGVVNAIYEDDKGTIWVATARGIAKLANGDDEFRVVIQSASTDDEQFDILELVEFQGGLVGVSASGDVLVVTESGASAAGGLEALEEEVLTSAVAVGDELYVAAISGRIFRLARVPGGFEVLDTIQSPNPVVDLHWDGESLIWLDREQGLTWKTLHSTEPPQSSNPVKGDPQGYYRAMAVQDPQNAWLSAGPNVIRRKNGVADVVRLPGRGNEVRSINVDPVGNLWIGTYYGLYYAVDTDFTVLETVSAYDAGVILSLTASGNQLFLGGQNLWWGEVGSNNFTEFALSLPADTESSLRIDPLSIGQSPITALTASEQSLLVGYHIGGMDVIDLESGRVTNITSSNGKSFEGVGVSAFTQVEDQVFLASFYLYGLVEVRVQNMPDAPPKVTLRRITDQQTLIGVYRIDDSTFVAIDQQQVLLVIRDAGGQYRSKILESASEGIIFAVEADGAGGAFLGIENVGVRHLSAAMLAQQRYAPTSIPLIEEYLKGSTIWHLLLDHENILWVTTNQGLYTFDLSEEKFGAHITYADGLPANEFDYGSHARFLAPNGERIFMSAKVPVAFKNPAFAEKKKIQLFWTDVSINGKPIVASHTPDNGAYLNVEFKDVSAGTLRIDYSYNDHIRASELNYAMRFGDTDDWVLQRNPSVVLTRQQVWGPVEVQIAMLDTNGNVASEPLLMTVDIDSPAYILWFLDLRYAIPALLSISLLMFFMQLSSRRRQQVTLDEANRKRDIVEAEMRGRLSEKEILLRELHHRVGNILTNFSSSVRAMQRSAKHTETRESLSHLNARLKVQSAIHLLLQRSDRTDINIASMIRQVSFGVRDLLQDQDSRTVELELDDVFMTYSKAQYLGLIVNELMTNTYKYAVDTPSPVLATISLTADGADGPIKFHFRDYGNGMDQATLEDAMIQRRYSDREGLAQLVGLALELGAEPQLYNDQGFHFELLIKRH
ncbi:two-component regulator propeller domain-containing protein [Congregibacter variabilis]|uniref:histidine kinase n=1 Tax=Congregibacter variabilis TaxID=3081200 RepID=A0ABZ0I408_9GAMM|nr:two-component regulator propeller domain-containing protein [Congregibacter sp. IMCC43200]